MSGQSGKWREEQILIVCPGSRTTMAQLGCHELTPPAYRIPTRMFRDEETDEWRPYHTYKRRKATASSDAAAADDDAWEYVEDPDSDEGAVYPVEGGYITNMEAFLAFLEHVHGLLTTTYHNTPIVLMASPQWTRPDCEAIALYIFEKTRTPALCMIHSALATQYGLKWPNMTVIDIGFEKVDVTCIFDSRIVNHMDVGYPTEPGEARAISGGEIFTQRLLALLRDKDFTYPMAEQLKKSAICEVLPYAPDQPLLMELPEDTAAAEPVVAAAAAATAVTTTADGADAVDADADVAMADGVPGVDSEGVLDVATLLTTGQTKEFLAKKEKEKSERGRFGRRGKDKEAEAAKPVRLPNAKRARTIFHYEELAEDETPVETTVPPSNGAAADAGGPTAAMTGASTNGKHEEEGSENGSEADGSEMDEDEEEEGEEEGGETEAESKAEEKKETPVKPAEAETAPAKPADAAPAAAPVAKAEEAAPTPSADAAMTDAPAAQPGTVEAVEADKPTEPAKTVETTGTAGTTETTPKEDTAKEEAQEAPKDEAAPATEAAAPAAAAAPETAPAPAPTTAVAEPQGRRFQRHRRDLEIGLERFKFADRTEIDRIVTTIYRTVQGIEDMYMRPACWENLVFVGNGSRLRGLRDNILQTLHGRHLVSPSTATMFTSELPSHLGTPAGTGSQTPTGSYGMTPAHQVNPLLQAATTGSVMGDMGGGGHSHHFHAQTPTTIKMAALPTYLGEWSKNGFEEAMFLGAQVAARLAFCVHNLDAQGHESQRLMYLGRTDYNEIGPKGIRTHSLLG